MSNYEPCNYKTLNIQWSWEKWLKLRNMFVNSTIFKVNLKA